MHFRILGPTEVVRADGEIVDLGVLKQRALLTLLLINANDVVSTDRIIDELWGPTAGQDREKALWVVVSRLRTALEPGRKKRSEGSILLSRPPGYLLAVEPADIDAVRFEAASAKGRLLLETDPAAASVTLSEALGLWRGHALEEFMYESFAEAEVVRLEELRLAALEDRIDADLRIGRARELVGELESLVRRHPRRERMAGHLMLALHLSGRQGDALRAFGAFRTHLSEELGLDPSPEISRLEERIVLDDPQLREVATVRALSGRPEPGLSIRGYELREQIGAGATGNVYRAFQPAIGREVAVKVIRPELANDPAFIRTFEAEAQLIARLEHPQIVPVFDFWREPDSAFLVTRRFERGSLRDLADSGDLTTELATALIGQIAGALAAAHRHGVAHGDLKPENVLIDGESNAYLADFGMSWSHHADGFIAPEQLAGGEATVVSDIFGLGRLAAFTLDAAGIDTSAPAISEFVARATAARSADRHQDVESFLTHLTSSLDTPLTPVDSLTAINPYRGLRAFEESDADRFFGRERLIERLLARLGHTGHLGRFVAVVGPSGSGKSSLVRAGLLPALRAGAAPTSERWFITTMVPGRHPFEALEEALRAIAVDPPPDLLNRLTEDGLASTVAALLPDPASQVVLVIDQLEELFALASRAEADRFMEAVAAAVADRHASVRVIVTLRADFYDHPLRHAAFGDLVRLGTEVITPMSAEELERAIVGPAAAVGVSFESGLVATVASDVASQPTALPLLQYALTELFDRRTGTTITNESYAELGGVSVALAQRADTIYRGLDPDGQRRVHDAFLRLVTLSDDGADTRRRALVAELHDAGRGDIGNVLDAFGRHRLLSFDHDATTRMPTVEIAHEALLSEWSLLRGWIDDARADIQAERQLSALTDEWIDADRHADFLLTGARLARFAGWSDRPPVALTTHETEFLLASEDATTAELLTERRRVRRLRRLVAGVGAALVVALIAGGVAVWQQRRAVAETERAELATLVSRSAAAISDAPDLALLLALEAQERAPGGDTRRALLSALAGSSTANRVLSRPPLAGDCFNDGDSFYADTAPGLVEGGPFQLQVVDGQAVALDPVSGERFDLGPMPFPCALGGRNGEVGGAGDIQGRIWVGPNFLPLDVRGSVLALTSNRTALAAQNPGGVEVMLVDHGGALIGEPIAGAFAGATAVSNDESLLAVAVRSSEGRSTDGTMYVIDIETGERLVTAPIGTASALAFDPFTGNLIAALESGVVATFDPRTGDRLSQVATEESFGYIAAGARADGTLVLVSRSSIEVVDRESGAAGRPFPIQGVVNAFVRPDGLVVTIRNNGQADVYDLEAAATVNRVYDVEPRSWIAIVDGTAAVVGEPAGDDAAAVELIDLATGERVAPQLVMDDGSTFPAVVAYPAIDGVWAVSPDHRLARWQNGVMVDLLTLGSAPGVRSDWYPGGRPYRGSIATLGIRPSGTVEASLVRLDDTQPSSAEVVVTVETTIAPSDPFGMAHPSPAGGIVVVDEAGLLTEYGIDGAVVREIQTEATEPVALTIDPTGSRLAVSSLAGGVMVIDLTTEEIDDVPGGYIASSLGFDGDGSTLGISVWGGEVRLYDVGSGEVPTLIADGTGTFGAEPGWFDAEADSLWLPASGSIVEIPLDSARHVATACEIVGRDLTQDEWDRFVPGDQPLRSVCASLAD